MENRGDRLGRTFLLLPHGGGWASPVTPTHAPAVGFVGLPLAGGSTVIAGNANSVQPLLRPRRGSSPLSPLVLDSSCPGWADGSLLLKPDVKTWIGTPFDLNRMQGRKQSGS